MGPSIDTNYINTNTGTIQAGFSLTFYFEKTQKLKYHKNYPERTETLKTTSVQAYPLEDQSLCSI